MKHLITILLVLLASPALSQRAGGDSSGQNGGADHDRARSAVERNEILSLKQISSGIQKQYGGRIIKVELEESDGLYVYKLKLITPQGRVVELEVDAATGLPVGNNERDGGEEN
ncbi:PepSY domain-containing protein [uncultured Thioclava sp.]|uniref:PepSY domain-containing protein n=1 Tax=Thioclava arctica TaxID=3238301 RepID=A0ABV3TNR4_9RHOB|nr:PepSY domain-containing protein [uncultured Thioclava sp.]